MVHRRWFEERCSTMRVDLRYTSSTVFDTFPWPQAPTASTAGTIGASPGGQRLRSEGRATDDVEFDRRPLGDASVLAATISAAMAMTADKPRARRLDGARRHCASPLVLSLSKDPSAGDGCRSRYSPASSLDLSRPLPRPLPRLLLFSGAPVTQLRHHRDLPLSLASALARLSGRSIPRPRVC